MVTGAAMRTVGVLLASWLLAGPLLAAEVTAELDRRQVTEGETVTLILTTDDAQQSLDGDFSGLERDFHVIDRRSETQMSIINGRQSATVRLLLTLEPKRTGVLQIPALAFPGGAATRALAMEVKPAPELAPGELPAVFIETQLEPQEGPYYVHSQLSLKVRIFYQQNLTEAAINPPAPEQASVRLLDEVPYQADRDGVRYRVLERRYAIFPERSGDLLIPPMQLTGRLIERASDRLWQPSSRGRRIRIESDPMTLSISPKPPEFSGPFWLPARRIDLSQQISDAESLRVGEPITRTVILDAVGLEEHMLEEPEWPTVSNARIYPDQPQGISRDDGEWVLGHREFRYAVVPERAGEMVLPEIRLQWWDTVNHRQRTAVLPEHRVTVLPSDLAGLNSPPGVQSGALEGAEAGLAMAENGVARWRMLTILFAALWLITLLLYLRGGITRSGPRPAENGATADEKKLIRSLREACQADDARAARNLLGQWVRLYGPPGAGGSLMDFAAHQAGEKLAAEIRDLDARRFRDGDGGAWQGKALWQAFRGWRRIAAGESGAANDDDLGLYTAARAMKNP